MSLYTKALRHIDMNRVKELREEKIKKQKIAEEKLQEEIIRAKLKKIYAEQIKHVSWRRELEEGMTTGSIMNTTLGATGDIDLVTTSMDASSFDLSTDASFGSGTGSGFIGGFSSSGGILNLSGDVESISAVLTNAVDLSKVDTVNISAIAGNNSNGGITPDADLFITFILGSEFSDEITVISKSSGSFSNENITIPENFRKSGVQIYLSTTTGTHGDQGRALKPHTIQINGLNHGTMGSLDVSNIVSFYLRDKAPSDTNYIDLGKYLWDNVQRALHGSEVSENPEYPGTPGAPEFLFNDSYTPAPVSGRTALAPTGGSNTVTNDDYRFIGEYVYDTFKGSKLYGVSNISFRRKTPMNVFVSLDDPEATAFIRDTLGNQNLSPTQKKKKLEQMLGASAEYLTKMFGEGIFTGASEISDVELQQSFAQIAANQVDLTPLSDNPYGTEIAQVASTQLAGMGINPDTATPAILAAVLGITVAAATEIRKGLDALQSVTGGFPNYGPDAGPTTTGKPLPGVGENTPEQQKEIDAAGKELSDAQRALNDLPDNATDAQRDMAKERVDRASKRRRNLRLRNRNQRNLPGYQGESVIHEKKKLKSPASLLDKIPGYYDGKPAPLGFPIEEPPKMVNGKHPDLVDGKKVSQRYNRLDPISAKSMPKTGNPHIDKKVRSAANKPK